MGGTTAKLSIIEDGKPTVAYSFEAAREKRFVEGSGLPVRISTLELIEIGAGGGSIAHLDDIGLLKVGPTSAGSEPGPAAYGRGGKEPTVTDADFVLGYLNPAYFVGGTMAIDMKAAEAAMRPLAERAGLGVTSLAWGIHDVVNENMASAARVHIAEHGKDPRRYALLCTGGAGPVHAYYVAKKLGLARLIAPRGAGVASALGLLIAPARVDRVATVAREIGQLVWPELEATFARLEADARAVLAATLPDGAQPTIARLADIRYVGQASELVVPLPAGPYTAASREALMQAFEASYVAAFTRTPPTTQVEIINVRVSASIEIGAGTPALAAAGALPAQAAAAPPIPPASATRAGPIKGTRPVYFPEFREFRPTTVYDRYALMPGAGLRRPRHRRGARVHPRHRPRRPLRSRRQRQHHRHHRVRDAQGWTGHAQTASNAGRRQMMSVQRPVAETADADLSSVQTAWAHWAAEELVRPPSAEIKQFAPRSRATIPFVIRAASFGRIASSQAPRRRAKAMATTVTAHMPGGRQSRRVYPQDGLYERDDGLESRRGLRRRRHGSRWDRKTECAWRSSN